MPKPVADSFLCWKDLKDREQELQEALDATASQGDSDRLLIAHGKLLELLRDGFPMLLLQPRTGPDHGAPQAAGAEDGSATITLPGEASDIRLIPARDPDVNERLLLIQYLRYDPDEPATIELCHWRWQDSSVELTRLPVQAKLEELPENHRLDNRPLEIHVISDDLRAVAFKLHYPDGKLLVMGNIQQGIVAQTWREDEAEHPWRFAERCSGGKQKQLLWVHRQTGGANWQDDKLSLDGNPNNAIHLDHPKIGRCTGVDAPTRTERLENPPVYLASSLGRVLRVNLATGRVSQSPPLGSRVLDVLVVNAPDKSNGEYCILATTYEGTIFWLKDEHGELGIRYWQHLDHLHIHRLIGTDNDHILAVDQYHRVIPLRLHDPASSASLRDQATRQLMASPRHRLVTDVGTLDFADRSQLLRAIAVFSLGLEHYLLQIKRGIPFNDPLGFGGWCQDLALSEYSGDNSGHDQALARLHQTSLQRLFQWMRNNQRWDSSCSGHEKNVDLQPIWDLLEVPESAPDWLWIYLFRNADVLTSWGQRLYYDQSPGFEQALIKLNERIREQRSRQLAGAHRARGLTVRATVRLPGQPRHVRELTNDDPSQTRLLTFVYGRGLFLITPQIDTEGTGTLRENIITFDRPGISSENEPWLGLPTALLTDLKLPVEFTTTGHTLFIGTDRGECHLLELIGTKARHLKPPFKVSFEIATARFLKLNNRCGILLGGSNTKFEAALAWLEINGNSIQSPRELWTQPGHRGVLRMLCPPRPDSEKDSGVCDHHSLWGVERHSGRLLCWNLDPLEHRGSGIRLKAKEWYTAGGRINAAVHIRSHQQVVCGGHNGLAVALSTAPETRGRLQWIAGCGSPIRYFGYSPATQSGPGLRLIAGDDDDCVICDADGLITGFLENVGPISALCRIGETRMALASSSGRIVLLDSAPPPKGKSIRHHQDHRISRWLQQPLCSQAPNTFPTIDKLPPGDSDVFKETLPSTRIFQWLQLQLRNTEEPELKQLLHWTVEKLLLKLPPDLAALFIRNPRRPADDGLSAYPEHTDWLLPLLEGAWACVAEPPAEGLLLCKLVNGILFIAEQRYLDGDQGFGPLIKTISHCLYNPRTADCPISLESGGRERLTMLRESQGTRVWQRINTQAKTSEPSPRRWLATLARLWQIPEPETFSTQLQQLLSTRLPFSGFVNIHTEMRWLAHLVDKNKQLSTDLIPEDFRPLVENEQFSLGSGRDKLIEAWPKIDNWRNWVEGFDRELTAWGKSREQIPHSALGEFMALEALDDRIGNTTEEIFRCDRELPLMGLLWQRLRPGWQQRIETAREQLEQRLASAENRYLKIEDQRIQWHNAHQAKLSFRILNDRPRGVSLTGWSSDDDTLRPLPGGNTRIEAGARSAILYFPLKTDTPDQMRMRLTLIGEDDQQIPVQRQVQVEDGRSLSGFRSDNAWAERHRRLEAMLEKGNSFWWLKGPRWPREDHQRLRTLVGDKRGDSLATITEPDSLGQLLDDHDPVFWPDLNLGQDHQGIALQLHEMLHHRANYQFDPLACALWLEIQPNPPLREALASLLPDKTGVRQLLPRLIAPRKKLQPHLPAATFVAWCCGDPLEPLLTDGSIAPPGPGRLGHKVWSTLSEQNIPASRLAELLGSEENAVQQCLNTVSSLPKSFFKPRTGDPNKAMLPVAERLLTALGDGYVLREKGILSLHLGQDQELWFLQEQFQRVYVILPGQYSPTEHGKLAPGLWLCLNTAPPAIETPNSAALRLNQDQVIALLTEPDPQERLRFLSNIGSLQLPLNSGLAFQTAGGLSEDKIGRHFHGRGQAIRKMQNCATTAGCGLVLVAGRRMGKTTLLQRMHWIFRHGGYKPLHVEFSWNRFAAGLHGAALERKFYEEIGKVLKPIGERFKPTNTIWKDPENPHQQQATRDYIASRLQDIKRRPGKGHEVPLLLLFDETQHLVDRENTHSFVDFLRDLRNRDLLSIIATAFPHGAGRKDAFITLLHTNSEDNPYYNFLPSTEHLEPWNPQTSWFFLTRTLGGYGILLPESRRQHALNLCRGIPWIAQALGEILTDKTDTVPRGVRRWIDSDIWYAARHQIMRRIRTELIKTVEAAAFDADSLHNANHHSHPGRLLGNNRLWDALKELASRHPLPEYSDDQHQREQGFRIDELRELLGPDTSPEAISWALNKMTQSLVLSGDQDNREQFLFTANIFPMWVQSDQNNE